MTYRNKRLTASAEGRDCELQVPGVCNGDPATTVWCHLNGLEFGKGTGHKGHDIFGFYGCSSCHDAYDGRRPAPARYNLDSLAFAACMRSIRIAADAGLL